MFHQLCSKTSSIKASPLFKPEQQPSFCFLSGIFTNTFPALSLSLLRKSRHGSGHSSPISTRNHSAAVAERRRRRDEAEGTLRAEAAGEGRRGGEEGEEAEEADTELRVEGGGAAVQGDGGVHNGAADESEGYAECGDGAVVAAGFRRRVSSFF